jgi:hypothetical protein
MQQTKKEKHFQMTLGILTFNIIMQIGSFGYTMDIFYPDGFSIFLVIRIIMLFVSILYAVMICLKGRYPKGLFLIPASIMMLSPLILLLEIYIADLIYIEDLNIDLNAYTQTLIPQFLIWIEVGLITWVMLSKRLASDSAITIVLGIIVYNLFMGVMGLVLTIQDMPRYMLEFTNRIVIGLSMSIVSELLIYVALIWNLSDDKKISSEELIS